MLKIRRVSSHLFYDLLWHLSCWNNIMHTQSDRWSRVAWNLISFLSGGKWLHKQYVNITEPLCRLTQTTGSPAGLCSSDENWLTATLSPRGKEINTFYCSDLTMWESYLVLYGYWDWKFVYDGIYWNVYISVLKVCFFASAGHNLAEVVSVHAYLCSGRASLTWVGEASLEYVQDDAQVLNKSEPLICTFAKEYFRKMNLVQTLTGLKIHLSIFHHFIP